MSDTPEQEPDETREETVTPAEVRVRRSPRYFRFMVTGAVLFAIVALILTFSFPENPTYDRGSIFGFLLAICAVVGIALGAVVALVLDRTTARRARSVQADRIDVRVTEPASPPARREGSQPEPGTSSSTQSTTSDTES
ncbi:hypothetical protein [Leifsonia sp. SIMBA_070]|uniref:hypothetical protein n=1 Tax=Leifsonia sp. SIMBA_070 TaxID=3085810 RepID=UPI0039783445